MPRTIILDSFPLSCLGKSRGSPPTVTDHCRQWAMDCITAGNPVRVPAITYYETLRELERLGATAQIARLKVFCFSTPDRFIALDTSHLEEAAKLWARARNVGSAAARPDALDGDMLLAAQARALGIAPTAFVVATTNVAHLAPFVPADHWTAIAPGS